jgi:hypothetical protein
MRWIPRKLRRQHEYCFFLHDEMVRLLVECEAGKAETVSFTFKNKAQARRFQRLAEKHDTIYAKRAIGYEEEARRVIINKVTFALTSDMLHHIYEALRCFEKRKIIVTFNLLRKPLLDSLVFLCWILADEDDFYDTFTKVGPQGLSAKAMGNRRAAVIEGALNQTQARNFLNAQLIQLALFDHRHPDSLYGLFQHAVHLVTLQKPEIATTNENLNFIFKRHADDDLYYELYRLLPLVLIFMAHVVVELFDRMKSLDPPGRAAFNFRSVTGMSLVLGGNAARNAVEMLTKPFADQPLCNHCSAETSFTVDSAIAAVLCQTYRCNACRRHSDLPLSWMFESADYSPSI